MSLGVEMRDGGMGVDFSCEQLRVVDKSNGVAPEFVPVVGKHVEAALAADDADPLVLGVAPSPKSHRAGRVGGGSPKSPRGSGAEASDGGQGADADASALQDGDGGGTTPTSRLGAAAWRSPRSCRGPGACRLGRRRESAAAAAAASAASAMLTWARATTTAARRRSAASG